MVRTQIQLPEPLYRDVQRVARAQDWSIAEVIRRGAEAITRAYPHFKSNAGKGWHFPPPLGGKLLVTDPGALRDLVRDDSEPRV